MGKAERARVSGEAAGVVHFKPASAWHGQSEPSAWRTHGGDGLTPVGHCSESEISFQFRQSRLTGEFQR